MNKLVIIGNGFDLAHGMKTRYQDFILWYLNDIFTKLHKMGKYSDLLFELSYQINYITIWPSNFRSTQDIEEFLKHNKDLVNINRKSDFFNLLLIKDLQYNWVDIEYEYYEYLKYLYSLLERDNFTNKQQVEEEVVKLNTQFEFLKIKLVKYLTIIESEDFKRNTEIERHIDDIFSGNTRNNTIMFLNFNYTSAIEKYLPIYSKLLYKVNYIHGKLNDNSNPIIFGFGDEIDNYYQKFENLNINNFLVNFKFLNYQKASNYSDFHNFIKRSFDVHIIGHSCGISDRVLFSRIFRTEKCQRIKIFYHEKSNTENDYIDKVYELSRHFPPNNKGKLNEIVDDFTKAKPLVKWKEL